MTASAVDKTLGNAYTTATPDRVFHRAGRQGL